MIADRPLLVGQAPSSARESRPLAGRSGRRLARLAGCSLAEFLERVDAVNLLEGFPGKVGKGDAFGQGLVTVERAALVLREVFRHRTVIFLGRQAASTLMPRQVADTLPFLTWLDDGHHRWSIMPHPSGIVRWWNDPAACRRAARHLREAMCST